MSNISTVEAGGIIAALAALVGGVVGFWRWLLGYQLDREKLRTEKLDAWEGSLADREQIEGRLSEALTRIGNAEQRAIEADERSRTVLHKLRGIRRVTVELVLELQVHAPDSEALARAKKHLTEAFPVDPDVPEDFAQLVVRLQEMD